MTVCVAAPILAEGQTTAGSGTTGDLALLDFSSWNIGPVAPGAHGPLFVDGTLAIVDHQNQRMLRASSRSTVVLSLRTALPRDFTVELDLVPKQCCQPEDVAIEGTKAIDQGPSSANIVWWHGAIRVIGGGETFDRPMPDAIAVALPGALTNIMITFRGDELTVYTNGQRIYTIPNRLFVRGVRSATLRVFLGGQNDSDQAVYLARFRVAAGAQTPVAAMPTVTMPNSAGATAGPVSAANPGGTTNAALFAPPAPRTIGLTGFAAAGVGGRIAPRTISIPGFTSTGVIAAVSSRTIALQGFMSTGVVASVPAQTIVLSGFTAFGSGAMVSGSAAASRTISVARFTSAGLFVAVPPKTIKLTAFSAVGPWSPVASRSVTLTAFTAAGLVGSVPSRTVRLTGWTTSGTGTP